MERKDILPSSESTPVSDSRAMVTSNDDIDDNTNPNPHSNPAAKSDIEDPMLLQSTTSNVAVQSMPQGTISQVLSQVTTKDVLIEIVGGGRQSKLRGQGRNHIRLLLLVNRAFYQEATKLINERLSVEVYLPAGDCLPHLKLIGCSGLWNTHRNIRVYLLRRGKKKHFEDSIKTLTTLWRTLRQKEVATDGNGGSWQQVEVISYDPDENQSSFSTELTLSTPRLLSDQQSVQQLLQSPVWAPVLAFDHRLPFVSSSKSYSLPKPLRHVLSRKTPPNFETDLPELQNRKKRALDGAHFVKWPSFKRPDTRITLSAALQLPVSPGQKLKFLN